MSIRLTTTAAAALLTVAAPALARDQINIVGSSTVFPFSTTVAERFGKSTNFKTPVVESTGSGGGLKLFYAGVGERYPDITNASRRIKSSEVKRCATNGVNDTRCNRPPASRNAPRFSIWGHWSNSAILKPYSLPPKTSAPKIISPDALVRITPWKTPISKKVRQEP